MQPCIIYALVDPRTHLVRYVGKSTTGVYRPRHYGQPAQLSGRRGHNPELTAWILELRDAGLDYEIVTLDTHSAGEGSQISSGGG